MRIFNWVLLLVLTYIAHGNYPECENCDDMVVNYGDGFQALYDYIDGLMRDLCEIEGIQEDLCRSTWDLAHKTLDRLNKRLFLEASPAAKMVVCSHLIPICPDKKIDGAELPSNTWSCSSCLKFLNVIFEFLSESVKNVNASVLKFFCPSGAGHCVDVFKTAFNVTGALGRLLHEKKSTGSICERIVKCID